MKIIDCMGLVCPIPVINTKKHFDSIDKGEALVIVDNKVARDNIEKFAKNCGYSVSIEEKNSIFNIHVIKENKRDKEEESKTFAIIVGTDELGTGDRKLGVTLMKSYMYALSESDVLPQKLIFLNSGVNLTVDTSDVLDSLKVIKDKGTEILSCGTCLDFYGIKEKLAIGEITNMYTIVEAMNNSDKVIKL